MSEVKMKITHNPEHTWFDVIFWQEKEDKRLSVLISVDETKENKELLERIQAALVTLQK